MAEGDDRPTGDEVDEVELEAARGGAADGVLLAAQDSAKVVPALASEDQDAATPRVFGAEDSQPGG